MSKNDDKIFLASIIAEICDYAVNNGMDPDDTLKTTAISILQFTEVATCNEWDDDNE